MLEVNGLFVDIKGQPILKGVDFSVKGGELMGLLGPSGCGKSTLLKAVAGILPPKSGSILIGGEDMANVPPHKRGAVIVFQDMRLFPNMTALDNELKEEIRALVLELHRKFRTTTVLVTHDRQEAFAMADRIAVMRDGRVMRQGSRDEMAAYLGNKEGEA